jgi:1-acyl-sn-glycerol-3-phosphate acyltransferase
MLLRTLLFQAAFYVFFIVAAPLLLPALLLPARYTHWTGHFFGAATTGLHRWITGIKVEIRGRENIPAGPLLVAAKHQSMWETVALVGLFDIPTFILKRELMRIPVFGWYLARTGQIPVDRAGGRDAMKGLVERARAAVAENRQLLIFPEGTRREPGAPPDYKAGVALLYRELGIPCLPIAHNAGLFWPRRSTRHAAGTIVLSILPPIPPGLTLKAFQTRLVADIEGESDRLLLEAADRGEGLFRETATARLAELRASAT